MTAKMIWMASRWIVFINAIFQMVSSASLVMHLTFVSWRSNFVLDGWMDGHPRVQHSNNNKLNNYQQNCFNPSRNLSGSRLNFTSLIRKGKVSPGLYLSTSTQLDWKKTLNLNTRKIQLKESEHLLSRAQFFVSLCTAVTASQGLSSIYWYIAHSLLPPALPETISGNICLLSTRSNLPVVWQLSWAKFRELIHPIKSSSRFSLRIHQSPHDISSP